MQGNQRREQFSKPDVKRCAPDSENDVESTPGTTKCTPPKGLSIPNSTVTLMFFPSAILDVK